MSSRIEGIQETKFTAKDGTVISGMSLYLSTSLNPKFGGSGRKCERIFLSTVKLESLSFKPVVGLEVEVLYNRYGKVQSLVEDESILIG